MCFSIAFLLSNVAGWNKVLFPQIVDAADPRAKIYMCKWPWKTLFASTSLRYEYPSGDTLLKSYVGKLEVQKKCTLVYRSIPWQEMIPKKMYLYILYKAPRRLLGGTVGSRRGEYTRYINGQFGIFRRPVAVPFSCLCLHQAGQGWLQGLEDEEPRYHIRRCNIRRNKYEIVT